MMENWGDGSFGERLAHSMGEQAAHIEQFGYCSCRGRGATIRLLIQVQKDDRSSM